MSKIIVTLFLSLFVLPNLQAAIDSTWLVNQQNPDGSFDAQNDIGYQIKNTSEVLRTLYAMGDIGLVDESLSLQKINASDSIHLENVVRKIIVNKLAGLDVSTFVAELRLFINPDGGFSSIVGCYFNC